MGDFESAIINFEKCLELKPELRACHLKAAQIFRDTENHNKVQYHLQMAIKIAPKVPDAYSYLADTYNNLKQFDLAIATYQQAIDLLVVKSVDPASAPAPPPPPPDALVTLYCSLGDTYSNAKQAAASLTSFDKAREASMKTLRRSTPCASIGLLFAKYEIGHDTGLRSWKKKSCARTRSTEAQPAAESAVSLPPDVPNYPPAARPWPWARLGAGPASLRGGS